MPLNSLHPSYAMFASKMRRCRDSTDSDLIKKGKALYLPRLTDQTDEEYAAYRLRATYYPIAQKAVSSMVGMITGQIPVFNCPEEMNSYFYDDTAITFYNLFGLATFETLLMGRFGVFVDRDSKGIIRLSAYITESILNWNLDEDGNPTMIVLREVVKDDTNEDVYQYLTMTQYRKIYLDDSGNCVVELYDANLEFVKGTTLLNFGKPMNYIPFYVVNPHGLGWSMVKSPVLDIVDLNISHYRTSADLEHGRHFTGLPVPVVSGVDSTTKLRIGSMTAWILPDPNAKAYYLEFKGEGLTSLETALKEKADQLSSLTSQMLTAGQNGSESPDALRLRFASETASLLSVARAVEALMNRVYQTIAQMDGIEGRVQITVDKDFLSIRLSAAEVTALSNSYIAGTISKETYIYNLRRGDMIATNRSDADEMASIVDSPASKQVLTPTVVSESTPKNIGGQTDADQLRLASAVGATVTVTDAVVQSTGV